ncbi:MAG: threonine synthase [Coriobacteriales bacterium]|jgi:threonine synthase|nr:threonine synthase [Coriobacteriales bacterium]
MTTNTAYINRYLDTRGLCLEPLTFTRAIVKGIAPGGGLFVPQVLPRFSLDEIVALGSLPYAQQAACVYQRFGVDLPVQKTAQLMALAYGDNFDSPAVAPVVEVAPGTHVLELWHGPTSAFKDMALQCLPVFFSAAIEQLRAQGEAPEDFLILVATSGDTGKAALEGFADRAHVNIIVYYPHGGVSDIQFKQMATQRGANVGVYGVRGNFDNCQTAVKGAFGDAAFNEQLAAQHKLALSSANSINWGRLLPQIVYYLSAYAQMVAQGSLVAGDPLDVCVPTGNFGNILAAWYAKQLGVPLDRLFCASNENRVLTDFINTGTYDISNRAFVLTPSPSMDILVSSNLERQLFELSGRDPAAIRAWMQDLSTHRRFAVDRQTFARLREHFSADAVTNDESLATIKEVHDHHGYLLDPHTAVAWKVAERLRQSNPVLVVSTAHWAKFGGDVYRALKGLPAASALPPAVATLSGTELNAHIAEKFAAGAVPTRLAELDTLPLRFSAVCNSTYTDIETAVNEWLQGHTTNTSLKRR